MQQILIAQFIFKPILICLNALSLRFLNSNNVDLYKVLVKELAQVLERQFTGNAESRAAGMVINTMGWIEGVGYEVPQPPYKLCNFVSHPVC